MKSKKPFLILILITTIFLSPIILNPSLFVSRENDLQEFFWPLIYFIKKNILAGYGIPLWNNLFLAGTPLLPDPQNPSFYLPNLVFLILPIDTGLVVSLFFHILLAATGTHLVSKYIFKFSERTSLLVATLYIASPKLSGYIEAGHLGLIQSWAWFPFVLIAGVKLAKKPNIFWSIILAISLAAIFYTHLLTFAISFISLNTLFLGVAYTQKNNKILRIFPMFFLTLIILMGLMSVSFLPQLEWKNLTTRSILISSPDVYPKWSSLKEFIKAIFIPWMGGIKNIWLYDSEKWITLGICTNVLAFIGFLKLNLKLKTIIFIFSLSILLIAANNISPLYHLLLSTNWYDTLRVSTRIWFLLIIIVTYLAGYGYEHLHNKKPLLANILIVIAISELVFNSWIYLNKQVSKEPNRFAPRELYEYLKNDPDRFRVFCTNRCLSQKEAAIYGLELIEGYSTLQQMNYYQEAWQLTGTYWNYYTLSIPPTGSYKFGEVKPDASSLGFFNTKYIISSKPLKDSNLMEEIKFEDYTVYRNKLFKPRAYFWKDDQTIGDEAPIISYTPNNIKVDTPINQTGHLVLSEVYSPGWKAFINGKEKVEVQEKPDTLRLVNLPPNTKFVEFKYRPRGFVLGIGLSLTTWTFILYQTLRWKKLRKK